MAYSLRERKGGTDYSLLNAGFTGSVYGEDGVSFARRLAAKDHLYDPAEAASRVRRLPSGSDFTLDWVRENGLKEPVLIASKEGLGLRMPGPGFTVRDVADVLGHNYPLEVMDVASQSEIPGWSLGAWADYFHKPASREAVLNCITLEFSGTPLERLVRAPRVVRQLDWTDTVWPAHRRIEGQYPSVQLYALMGASGSWTDAHIDFAGSSVWYHVHTGKKVFYFSPPTEGNLKAYEAWTASPEQATTFFAEWSSPSPVTASYKVEVAAGETLIIPAGYIHAVFTPEDSLVFGGNFLSFMDVPGQLRIFQLEQSMRVPRKFRFPYLAHMYYYAVGYALQFARLPGWVPLMAALERERQDVLAQQALEDLGSSSAAEEGGGFKPSQQLRARLAAIGLSWPEVSGLPALADMLLHLRRLALARAGALDLTAAASSEEGLEAEAAAALLGAGTAPPAAAAVEEPPAKPRLKLKLGSKAKAEGGAAAAADGSAPPPAVAAASGAPQQRRTASKKGTGKPRVKGAIVGDGMIVGDDENDAFPSPMAAQEAACMANALSAEEMLEELRARIGAGRAVLEAEAAAAAAAEAAGTALPDDAAAAAEHAVRESIEERWPPVQPASVLRQHRVLLGITQPSARQPTVVSALAAHGGFNPPKGTVGNPPLQALVGGFGLYNGAFPAFVGEGDEVSAEGAGYSYNEAAGESGDGSGDGKGEDEEDELYEAPDAAAAAAEEDDDEEEEAEGKAPRRGRKRKVEDSDSDFSLDEDEDDGDDAEARERRRQALSEEIAELQADAADLLLRDASGKLIRREGGGEDEALEALIAGGGGGRRRRRRGEDDDGEEDEGERRPRKRAKKAAAEEGEGSRGPRRGAAAKPGAAGAGAGRTKSGVTLSGDEGEDEDGNHASYFEAGRGAAHAAFGGTKTSTRRLLPAGGAGGSAAVGGASSADARLADAYRVDLGDGGGGLSEIVIPAASSAGNGGAVAPPPAALPRAMGLSVFGDDEDGDGDLVLRPTGPRAVGPRRGPPPPAAAAAAAVPAAPPAAPAPPAYVPVIVAPPAAPPKFISLGPPPASESLTGAALLRARMEALRKGGRR